MTTPGATNGPARGGLTSKAMTRLRKVGDELRTKAEEFTLWLHHPCDPSNLAVTRILFGAVMILDQPEERGLAFIDERWGDPTECRFPLFNFLKPLPLVGMYLVHLVMLIGAIGITTGTMFKKSCVAFLLPYWYIFLLEKSRWNNHSYLYGIIALLLSTTGAHRIWSIDSWRNPSLRNTSVPRWNYVLIRAQVVMVYFIAGLKKLDTDWIGGHSMEGLARHWVFDIFKFVLTEDQVELYIVHWGGFLLDLTVGFVMITATVRPLGVLLCVLFNAMNSRMFAIGMFPYTMIVMTSMFFDYRWPKNLISRCPDPVRQRLPVVADSRPDIDRCWHPQEAGEANQKVAQVPKQRLRKWKLTTLCIVLHMALQLFLPYSHWLTKGYNTWTQGSYGYSWDMMVHNWRPIHVKVTVFDINTRRIHFLDHENFTQSHRWYHQADMVVQFAHCARDRVRESLGIEEMEFNIDVWMSLNGRFTQRMYDPTIDILNQTWSPFKEVPWVLPVLTSLDGWRGSLRKARNDLLAKSPRSDVEFIADFPGFFLMNYIDKSFENVSLEVLRGTVSVMFQSGEGNGILLPGEKANMPTDEYHIVTPLKHAPACYMYIFVDRSQDEKAGRKKSSENEAPVRGTRLLTHAMKEVSVRSRSSYAENWKISFQRMGRVFINVFEVVVLGFPTALRNITRFCTCLI